MHHEVRAANGNGPGSFSNPNEDHFSKSFEHYRKYIHTETDLYRLMKLKGVGATITQGRIADILRQFFDVYIVYDPTENDWKLLTPIEKGSAWLTANGTDEYLWPSDD